MCASAPLGHCTVNGFLSLVFVPHGVCVCECVWARGIAQVPSMLGPTYYSVPAGSLCTLHIMCIVHK